MEPLEGRAPTRLNRPLSVTFLIRILTYGGAERQVIELADGLQRRGHRVRIVTFYPMPAGADGIADDARARGITIHVLNKSGRWDVFGFGIRLVRCLREYPSDIVHSYLVMANVLVGFLHPLLRGAKVVWGVRGSSVDYQQYDWWQGLSFTASRILARSVDAVIANSDAGATSHIALGYPPERMHVVSNGIDAARFHMDRAAGQPLRSAWGVGEHQRLIGLIGRLDPQKGHGDFLEAASALAKGDPDVRFVCVGSDVLDRGPALREQADRLGMGGRVVWAGPHADMTAVYNTLDVCCLPSRFGEGFPNVVAEAMACGVPCVVTDVGDSARIVADTGWVVPPSDPPRLAAALADALESLGPERSDRCRNRITSEFGTAVLVDRTEQVFSSLLGA